MLQRRRVADLRSAATTFLTGVMATFAVVTMFTEDSGFALRVAVAVTVARFLKVI